MAVVKVFGKLSRWKGAVISHSEADGVLMPTDATETNSFPIQLAWFILVAFFARTGAGELVADYGWKAQMVGEFVYYGFAYFDATLVGI